MVHSDSQISMRSLYLILLFTPVGCIFTKRLTKCLSRLGLVRLRPSSSFVLEALPWFHLLSWKVSLSFWQWSPNEKVVQISWK